MILLFNTLRSHLNSQNQTADGDLEKQNLQVARKNSCWCVEWCYGQWPSSNCKLRQSNRAVETTDCIEKSEKWIVKQVRQSHIMTQIVKCGKDSCCSSICSNQIKFFPERFLQAPISLSQSEEAPAGKDDCYYHSVFTSIHFDES